MIIKETDNIANYCNKGNQTRIFAILKFYTSWDKIGGLKNFSLSRIKTLQK